MNQASKAKRVAILGANGRLSREVARAFHAANWQVRAITRSGQSEPLQKLDGIDFVKANALIERELIQATENCDIIFNGLNPPYTDWQENCPTLASNVIAAAKAHKAVHLFAGNVYNFGSKMPEALLPGSPVRPDHKKAHIRTSMETVFANAALDQDIQTIILRAGDFYGGDGTGSWFDELLIKDLHKGKVTYPGNNTIPHAWAYLPDLARAFVALAERAADFSLFETFHFEGHNVSGQVMHEAIEKAVGKDLKAAKLPLFILKLLGLFSPKMREISEVSYLWTTPHQMTDPTLENKIGKLAHTPLVEAVRQAIVDQDKMELIQASGEVQPSMA